MAPVYFWNGLSGGNKIDVEELRKTDSQKRTSVAEDDPLRRHTLQLLFPLEYSVTSSNSVASPISGAFPISGVW